MYTKPIPEKKDSFHALLSGYSISELQELANLLHFHTSELKADLIHFLIQQLTTTGIIQQLWEDLNTVQKKAVAETLYSPSTLFPQTRFRAKYGVDPDWGNTKPGKKLTGPSKLCLFIYKLQIPLELKNILYGFVAKPGKVKVKHIDELPLYTQCAGNPEQQNGKYRKKKIISLNTEYAVTHEFPSILQAVALQKVGVNSSTKRLSKAGINVLHHLLYGGDYYSNLGLSKKECERIGFSKPYGWFFILKSLDLVYIEDSILKLTDKGKGLKGKPIHESIKQIWNEWLITGNFDELSRIDSIKGQQGKGKRYLTDVTERRKVCVDTLLSCPTDRWIPVDELFTYMLARGLTFYITTSPETLYITDPLLGHMGYSEEEGWNILEIRYALVFFFEYMATLGLLDIGYTDPVRSRPDYYHVWGSTHLPYLSQYDGLHYIRINNLGAYCLGLTHSYTRTPYKKTNELKVLTTCEIVTVKQLHPGDEFFLRSFTLKKSDNVWELDRTRITEAIEQGFSLSLFIEFLNAKSGGDLPENISHFLAEINVKQDSLTLAGKAWIIKADSPDLARLIINNKRLKSCCTIAGNTTIVVPVESKKIFLKVIHDLGYSLLMKDFI